MYTLYNHPYSQHCRRVVSLLEIAGLAYESIPVALDKGAHHSPQFLRLNPNHQVPILVDGELVLTESNAILRYLCQKHDLHEWYPTQLLARAKVEQWLDWNQCRLSPSVVDVVLNSVFLGKDGDRQAIERGKVMLLELLPILDRGLNDDYLCGPQATIADLSVASNITQLSLAEQIPEGRRTREWYQRICALDGFTRALPRAA